MRSNQSNNLTLKSNLSRTIQQFKIAPILLALVMLMASTGPTMAQTPLGTSFTYQGQLQQSTRPANGDFDLEFNLFDGPDPLVATQLGTDTKLAVPIENGLFNVELDFGSAVFNGEARWLQIGVRDDGASPWSYIAPLQPLTAAPYALFALSVPPVDEVPPGVIVMWSGLLADIPSGWALCDGTGGTPNLLDRFILGVQGSEEPGATGGTRSHVHSIGGGGEHSHTGITALSNNNLSVVNGSGIEGVRQEHTHNFTTNPAGAHTHGMDTREHLPPYYKLAFIIKL